MSEPNTWINLKVLNFQASFILHQRPDSPHTSVPILQLVYKNNDYYNSYSYSLSQFTKSYDLIGPSQAPSTLLLSPLGKLSPRKGERLTLCWGTKADGLPPPSLGLFLLNCRGIHNKLFFNIDTEIGQNPDSWIQELFFLILDTIMSLTVAHTYWGLGEGTADSDDCKKEYTLSGNDLG